MKKLLTSILIMTLLIVAGSTTAFAHGHHDHDGQHHGYSTSQSNSKKYTIHYCLNGGKNHSGNPSCYHTTETVKLKNPVRKGYVFQGWYSDKQCKKKVTSIKKGCTGKKTLYAKWKKK